MRGCHVAAWDRDPALVRLALSRWDWSESIRAGRLRLSLGVDLIDWGVGAADATIAHPLLGQIYHLDLRLLAAPSTARRALVCAGGLFVDDVADALTDAGYVVYLWDIHRLSERELDGVVDRFDPALVFAINHTHGLAEAFHRLNRRLIVWEIDPATDALRPCGTPIDHVTVYTYRAAHVARFHRAGFGAVAHVPLASNTQRRVPATTQAQADASADGALCFVGASMVDQAHRFRDQLLEAWVRYRDGDPQSRAEGRALLDQVLADQRERQAEYAVPELLEARMGDFAAAARQWLQHDPTAMVAEMAAAERRLNIVGAMGPMGIRVWGDAG
jgi:hypothetical protein